MASQLTKRMVNASTGKPRVCLVTGGASGIGASAALQLARAGANVAIADLPKQAELGMKVVEQIVKEAPDSKAFFLGLDVREDGDWERVLDELVTQRLGPLDVLIHSAGIFKLEEGFETVSSQFFKEIIDVNLFGTFLALKWGVKYMKENKVKESKSIVTLSSIAGIVGFPSAVSYTASKGGVRNMTKSVALYCAQQKYNIRVNSVHPGLITTPMTTTSLSGASKEAIEATMSNIEHTHPIGRAGEPREIGDICVFLGSEESSFMTGSEVVADGGYIAQ